MRSALRGNQRLAAAPKRIARLRLHGKAIAAPVIAKPSQIVGSRSRFRLLDKRAQRTHDSLETAQPVYVQIGETPMFWSQVLAFG